MAEDLVDLDGIGITVEEPDVDAQDAAREALSSAGADGLGRVSELALWWALVRGDAKAAPATQVVHLGATTPLRPHRTAGEVRRQHVEPADGVPAGLRAGVDLADDLADRGVELLLLSVDEPIPARVLAAELLGLDAVEACGWPLARGLDDRAWMEEVAAVRDGLFRTRGLRGNPGALLTALGSPQLAAATALLLQAALRRTPVLLDGPGAVAAALLARRSARIASAWWQAAQRTDDPVHSRALASLDLTPLVALGVDAEDGTCALIALALLDLAADLLSPAQ